MIQLTQKERLLLEDQKSHEELCILKYSSYAQQAKDAELKQLFSTYAGQEQQHLNTINQILSGQQPAMGSGQQQQQQGQGQQAQPGPGAIKQPLTAEAQNDAALCQDMLSTEKYVSATYDTAIFEMTNAQVRQALNHIQKEEQQHGEGIFNYMHSKGYYQPK
ncbi:MAG TPA: spore coat protein [Bacillota bacterium]|jgi:spore coat protein CotF|nr:spore coat protein [Bacillota bacterium]HOJ84474.1 spore coat protein [Bacillota bacterium]HOL15800.1 spore coat protein [Bacillota bacterium]HPZ12409.1 spore coat protein [Bacillota bacterium]HQE10695.1 spore coat protein [Bacillota bacterium]